MPLLRTAAATVLVAALLVGVGAVASGQSDTLAVDVSVDEAAAALSAAEAGVEDLRGQLAVLQLERAEYSRRLAQRDARREQAARDLRTARTSAQQLAVQAYMGAGSAPTPETVVFGDGDILDYTFRSTLVQDSTEARYRAATYYLELREQASDAVATTVEHLDALDDAIALTQLSLGEAEDAQRTAAIILAEAEEAERAARQAAAVPVGYGIPAARTVATSPSESGREDLRTRSGRPCASASPAATTRPSAPPVSTGAPTSSTSAPGPPSAVPATPPSPPPPNRTTGPRSSGPSAGPAPGPSAAATCTEAHADSRRHRVPY